MAYQSQLICKYMYFLHTCIMNHERGIALPYFIKFFLANFTNWNRTQNRDLNLQKKRTLCTNFNVFNKNYFDKCEGANFKCNNSFSKFYSKANLSFCAKLCILKNSRMLTSNITIVSNLKIFCFAQNVAF